MLALFYKGFSKRRNSTKTPDESVAYDNKEVVLKVNTSKENPTFIINGNIETDYNYVLWNRHYYFINDIVSINNSMIEVHCSQDILATYKEDIGNYTAYVERSASEFDEMLNDNAISMTTDYTQASATTSLGIVDTNEGFYVLRCISKNGYATYITKHDQIKQMFSMLLGTDATSMTYFMHNTFAWSNYIYKPQEHILSFKWLPFNRSTILTMLGLDPSTTGSDYKAMWVGWNSALGNGWEVTGRSLSQSFEPNLPAQAYNDFRAYNNNWTQYGIYIPTIGQVALDSSIFNGNIEMKYALDFDSCEIMFSLKQLSLDGNKIVSTWKNVAGIDIPLASTSNSSTGITQLLSLAGTVIGSASHPIQSAIAGASIVNGAVNTMVDCFSATNGNGNKATWELYNEIIISRRSFNTKDIPTVEVGRPCCRNLQLGTLSGFIQCGNASIDIAGLGNDNDIINNYLNSGFYYE